MLIRLTARVGLLGVLAATVLAVTAGVAHADDDGPLHCPPYWGECTVKVKNPGGPGGGSGGGGGGGGSGGGADSCWYHGIAFPCWNPNLGWFNSAEGCYYLMLNPQPPTGDPRRQGHPVGDGAVYWKICYPDVQRDAQGQLVVTGVQFPVWLASPPLGFGGNFNVYTLAAEAINRLGLQGPDIGIAPNQGPGLVGLPVWLWTTPTPPHWGTFSATAAVPGMSVTATARPVRIVWDMGNGDTVTCANPGTAHTGQPGQSPDCGYRGYSRPGRYTVTGTTTWQVDWVGAGAAAGTSGTVTVTRQSTTEIEIQELQVVIK